MRECSTAHDISHAHAAAHGFLICSEEKNQKISKCQQQLAGKLLILCYLFSWKAKELQKDFCERYIYMFKREEI